MTKVNQANAPQKAFIDASQSKEICATLIRCHDITALLNSDAKPRHAAQQNKVTDNIKPLDDVQILCAIAQINAEAENESRARNDADIKQKICLVANKLEDMRQSAVQPPSVIANKKVRPNEKAPPSDKPLAQAEKSEKERKAKALLTILNAQHKNESNTSSNIEKTEEAFLHQFGNSFKDGLSVSLACPEEAIDTLAEQTRCFIKHHESDHYLLSQHELNAIKNHSEQLTELASNIRQLNEEYTPHTCRTLACNIMDKIIALSPGKSLIIPVSWDSGQDGAALHLVTVTRANKQDEYSITLNTAVPHKSNTDAVTALAITHHPDRNKTLYEKFVQFEKIPSAAFFQENASPLIIEGLLELSTRSQSRVSPHSLQVLLGKLGGTPKPLQLSHTDYKSLGRWQGNIYSTLERELEREFKSQLADQTPFFNRLGNNRATDNANSQFQRANLALQLHNLEAHLVAWLPKLPVEKSKQLLLERTLQNLARRAAKLKDQGMLSQVQATALHERLSGLTTLLVMHKKEHRAELQEQLHQTLHKPIPPGCDIQLGEFESRIPTQPKALATRANTQRLSTPRVTARPHWVTPSSLDALTRQAAELREVLYAGQQNTDYSAQNRAISDFIRTLPLPSHQQATLWSSMPTSEIPAYTKQIADFLEQYMRNEANLPERLPERSLVIGKALVILTHLTQRIPELNMRLHHVKSLNDFFHHAFTDYGYYLNAEDGQQFYTLAQWVDEAAKDHPNAGLLLGLPESQNQFDHSKLQATQRTVSNGQIHPPTLAYFRHFIKGSSHQKTPSGKINEDYNPLRADVKAYLKGQAFFSQLTARKRRNLRREDDVLAMTLMSDLGVDTNKSFLDAGREALYDLRRTIIFSQITRHESPPALMARSQNGDFAPIKLDLSFTAARQRNWGMQFFFGQCLLSNGGALTLHGPGNGYSPSVIAAPADGAKLYWRNTHFKNLMIGGHSYTSNTGTKIHYHNRESWDNKILVEGHEAQTLDQRDRYVFSRINMAHDTLIVRKAVAFYRENMHLLTHVDHQKQLALMLCRNDAYRQVKQSFSIAPNGGALHHELKSDSKNFVAQLAGLINAGLFRFEAEERVKPLLFLAQLSEQLHEHIGIALAGNTPPAEHLPNGGLGTLKRLMYHPSAFTAEADRAKIARMLVILLGTKANPSSDQETLSLAVTAMSLDNVVGLTQHDAYTLNDAEYRQAKLTLIPLLSNKLEKMDAIARGKYLNGMLANVERALAPTRLKGLSFTAQKKDPEAWTGTFPLYHNKDIAINVIEGEIYKDNRPLGNRLPTKIRDHQSFRNLFGRAQPIAKPLSANTYSIFEDQFRLSRNSNDHLQIQQQFQLNSEEPSWYELQIPNQHPLLYASVKALTSLSPNSLLYWAQCHNRNDNHSSNSSRTWLATPRSAKDQPCYQIVCDTHSRQITVSPIDRPDEKLSALPSNSDDRTLIALNRFEEAEHIAVWTRKSDKMIQRLSLPRFAITFERDGESSDLVWAQDTKYKLSDNLIPIMGGFQGALQLVHREDPRKRLLVMARGALARLTDDDDNHPGSKLLDQPTRILPNTNFSTLRIPFSETGQMQPRTTEEKLRVAMCLMSTHQYAEAIAWIQSARKLTPLTANEQSAAEAALTANALNQDWHADAIAARLQIHVLIANANVGMSSLSAIDYTTLIRDVTRYIDLHNNIDARLRLNSRAIDHLSTYIEETTELSDTELSDTELSTTGLSGTGLSEWADVKSRLQQLQPNTVMQSDRAATKTAGRASTVKLPTTALALPLLTRETDQNEIDDCFEYIFNSRKRPLTRRQLFEQLDKMPVVQPDSADFASLFKSIFLLIQRDQLSLTDKSRLSQRIAVVDTTTSRETGYTQQLLTLLLSLDGHDIFHIIYPRDSWQRPTDSGGSYPYQGLKYNDDPSDLDDQSADFKGSFTYEQLERRWIPLSGRRRGYYADFWVTRSGIRGSYIGYHRNGLYGRRNEEITSYHYRQARYQERLQFVNFFERLLPETAAEKQLLQKVVKPRLFTSTTERELPLVQWRDKPTLPQPPEFTTGKPSNFSGSTPLLKPTLLLEGTVLSNPKPVSNRQTANGAQLDISELAQGKLASSKANHASVLEEQVELFQHHVTNWFDQSPTRFALHEDIKIDELRHQLSAWLADNKPLLDDAKTKIVANANRHTDAATQQKRTLAELGLGHHPLSWETLIIRLGQRNTQALVESNPSLTPKRIADLNAQIIEQLVVETRIQQAERALMITEQLASIQDNTPVDTEAYDQVASNLATVLSTHRYYDPKKTPEYLVWEAVGGIVLRENQVAVLDQLLHRHSSAKNENDDDGENASAEKAAHEAVVQLIMGAGKTKALLPLYMALVPKMANKLPVAMVPKPLLEINAGDLSLSLQNAFEQFGYSFKYERQSPDSPAYIKGMMARLQRAKAQNGFMITSRESIQALELKLQDIMEAALQLRAAQRDSASKEDSESQLTLQALEEKSALLADFILEYRKVSDVLIDEIDYSLDTRFEVNYTIGKPVGLVPERLDLVTSVFEALLTNTELPFAEKLRENEQASLGTQALSDTAKELLITEVLFQFEGFEPVRETLISDFALTEYLSGRASKLPNIISDLAKEESKREIAQCLVLLREHVNTLLPATLAKSGGEAYGFSVKKPASLVPGPRDKGKHKEGSNFANPYESLNYLYQLVSDNQFQWHSHQVASWLDTLQKQQLAEVAESPMDPMHTKSQAILASVLGPTQSKFTDLSALQTANKPMMRQLTTDINSQAIARLRLARHLGAPNITQSPRKLTNNPYDLVDASGHVQGFSGTLWNASTYPSRLKANLVAETDGKVSKILIDLNKTDIVRVGAKTPDALLESLSVQGALRPHTRAFIDAGAIFRGISGAQVADALLAHFAKTNPDIKGVLYFDLQDHLVLKRHDGSSQVLPSTDPETLNATGLNKDERFTYYDQPRTVGTDIGQGANAHALVTLGINTTKRDWFQGVLRMRQPETQSFTIVVPDAVVEKMRQEGAAVSTTLHATPTMAQLVGHTISNESTRLATDKYRAATQQIKNSVTRALKDALLLAPAEERLGLYEHLNALLSESLLDDPLNTMANIDYLRTPAAIARYRDGLRERLTQHQILLQTDRPKLENLGIPLSGKMLEREQLRDKALALIETQIAALDMFNLDALIHRLGALPYTVRTSGSENFGSEVQTEQELEVELEIQAARIVEYETIPRGVKPARPSTWKRNRGETVYSTPNLLTPTNAKLVASPTRPTVHRVQQHAQRDFFSSRLLATSNFLKTRTTGAADIFKDMTANPLQKPVEFLLVEYDKQTNTPSVVILSPEEQQYFLKQLTDKGSARQESQDKRRLLLCDLSGQIIRAGNSGLSQMQLDNDTQFQRLRVEAKLLNAPRYEDQYWSPIDQRFIRNWIQSSDAALKPLKKKYLELFALRLNLNLD